ncbi:hypothetical protein Q7P35_007146 [Cladosporium inversicolor]
MLSNTSNGAQDSETSSAQHLQASTPSLASTEIAHLRKGLAIKEARIKDLETQLSSVQALAHDNPPAEQTEETPVETQEATSTPNDTPEELYCYGLCPSYGPMVACDHPRCERKWFRLHHTNFPSSSSSSSSFSSPWICTRFRGWEALYDRGCWRCPKCFHEVLDEDEDYDEGVPSRMKGWEEDGDGDGDGESGSGDEVDDDGIEHNVDSEDAEMDYDDVEGDARRD